MDEIYLKMILALPDTFFDGWEWQAGNNAITITSHREVMIISNELISKSKYPGFVKVIYPYSDDDTPEFFKISQLRPVPSQEQLQKMLESKILTTGGNLWHVFCTFDEFVHSEYERRSFLKTGILITDSFEMLWLACVMKEKYKKTWDGKKWI